MEKLRNKFRIVASTLAISIFSFGIAMAQDDEADKEAQKLMPLQLTIISPLGTNGMQSGSVVNVVSLNMLAGISGGVRGIELGGLANFSKGDIIGLQAAGLSNGSLGYLKGIQLGGLTNFNRGFIQGGQFAGLVNVSAGKMEGAQFAGLVNVNTARMDGAQLAGLINLTTRDASGIQSAGLINTTTAGFEGVQLAGIVNVATREMHGAQIGLINFTKTLSGFQLGLVNVADSVHKGAGLGLLTYYRNGYHAFEIEYNETFRANATFKSGVDRLYMIYTLGFKTKRDKTYWSPGIGVGSKFTLSETADISVDLISRHVNEDEWWTKKLNMLNTLKFNLAYNITDKVAFYGGPSYNIVISGIENDEGNIIGDSFSPSWHFFDKTYRDNRVKMYFGFNAGLRF